MNLERILEAAKRSATTAQGRSRVEDTTWAPDYAEPGYGPAPKGVAFNNWNAITEYRHGTRSELDDVPERLSKALEHAGVQIEWSDEWTTCDNCGKAVRTSANSYGWTRSYHEDDNGVTCSACTLEDASGYLESLEGNSKAAVTLDVDPAEHGYVKVNTDSYASGLHPGQKDSPEVVAASLNKLGVTRYLFKLDDVGQLDVHFSVYVHEDEMPLVHDAAQVKSELPYDPATEMAKALRGEPNAAYTMTTRVLSHESIQQCPIHSFAPDHYNEDGTCQCAQEVSDGTVTSEV